MSEAIVRQIPWLGIFVAFATMAPISVRAQTGVVVQGQVVGPGGTAGIQNAVVEMGGRATLTSAEGDFRFEGVTPGGYTLRVDAFGYTSTSRFLTVEEDLTVAIELEIAPFRLDPLLVEPREIDIEGEVRDPGRDLELVNAEVLTNQVPPTRTDAGGRFSLEDVFEGAPLRVIVRAFGYLPVDTILLPAEDERYVFELEADTVAERMIAIQVERLEDRAAPRRAAIMRPMNRERLLRYAGSYTLRDVLETQYRNFLGRIRCVLIDEVVIQDGGALLAELGTTLPEEVERLEFLFEGAMLRIYTREFIQDMIARDIELRRPVYVSVLGPPVCH